MYLPIYLFDGLSISKVNENVIRETLENDEKINRKK